MQIVVFSSPGSAHAESEVLEVVKMFGMGLKHFHIRKPRFSRKQMQAYILAFPEEYRSRLVLHSYHSLAYKFGLAGIHLTRHHRKRGRWYHLGLWLRRRFQKELVVTRSFHKVTDLSNDRTRYSYGFLSPVFDSISHDTLSAGYSKRSLLLAIPQARQPVLAMGGVDENNLTKVAEYGFHGVALLGSIWESTVPPHEKYRMVAERCASILKLRLEV
jgi:thiamine-phosphate pyrophosphorylase